jgi:hypothetical protein
MSRLRKLVLDANILVVFIIGAVDPTQLGVGKQVKEYQPDDFGILVQYLTQFGEIILLPNTITEASNLLDHLAGEWRERCMQMLAILVQSHGERYIGSNVASRQTEYMRLGITDAAILCSLDSDTYLLTSDRALWLAALCRSPRAEYFGDLH